MSIRKITMLALLTAATCATNANAQNWKFRGIDRLQVNDLGEDNLLTSPALDRMANGQTPFFIDVEDSFDRLGGLDGSEVDTHDHEFVPPQPGLGEGPLSSPFSEQSGTWRASSDLAIQNGSVTNLGNGTAIAAVPWIVEPGLGDDYLVEANATIAVGETVQIGYLGSADLENARIGQLALGIERLDGFTLRWDVTWDEDGQQQVFSSQLVTSTDTTNEDLRLQLGWQDLTSGNDLFDAWLETPDGNTRLAQGNMLTAIDVAGVGFAIEGLGIDGMGSSIDSFTAAVPEPAAATMLAGIMVLAGFVRRRRNVQM